MLSMISATLPQLLLSLAAVRFTKHIVFADLDADSIRENTEKISIVGNSDDVDSHDVEDLALSSKGRAG